MKVGASIYGRVLAGSQILLILTLLALGCRGVWQQQLLWIGIVIAIVLGTSAVIAMRIHRVRILPEPGMESELCTHGVYRWIRHPMYSASLLLTGVFSIGAASWISAVLWLLLLIVLFLKLVLEERLWLERSPVGYAAYMKRTKRMVPFLV